MWFMSACAAEADACCSTIATSIEDSLIVSLLRVSKPAVGSSSVCLFIRQRSAFLGMGVPVSVSSLDGVSTPSFSSSTYSTSSSPSLPSLIPTLQVTQQLLVFFLRISSHLALTLVSMLLASTAWNYCSGSTSLPPRGLSIRHRRHVREGPSPLSRMSRRVAPSSVLSIPTTFGHIRHLVCL